MSERNPYLFVALLLLLGTMILMYWTKFTVATLDKERQALELQMAEEHEALRVLQAEWAHLNRPERLRRLAAEYLPLAAPSKTTKLITTASLPEMAPVPTPQGRPAQAVAVAPTSPGVVLSSSGGRQW